MKKELFKTVILLILFMLFSCRESADDEEKGRIVYFDSNTSNLYIADHDGNNSYNLTSSGIVTSAAAHSLVNSFADKNAIAAYTTGTELGIYDLGSFYDYGVIVNAGSTIYNITVSPDRQYIAYTSLPTNALYSIQGVDGSTAYSVNYSQSDYSPISWSPDSKYIVIETDNSGAENLEIRISNLDGSSIRQITNAGGLYNVREPKWSPKGDRILYTSSETSNTNIYSVKTDGSDLKVHTTTAISATEPAWSPNADRIAYIDNSVVYVVDTDSANPKAVFSDYNATAVSWSAYGEWLLVTAYVADNDIFCVDPESGNYFTAAGGAGDQMYAKWLAY